MLRRLQPCQRVVPLMSESMERRLGVVEFLKLRLHLLVCAWCARYLKQIRLFRNLRQLQFSLDQTLGEAAVFLTLEARQRIAEGFNR